MRRVTFEQVCADPAAGAGNAPAAIGGQIFMFPKNGQSEEQPSTYKRAAAHGTSWPVGNIRGGGGLRCAARGGPAFDVVYCDFSDRPTQCMGGLNHGLHRFGELLQMPSDDVKLLFFGDADAAGLLHGSLEFGLPLRIG